MIRSPVLAPLAKWMGRFIIKWPHATLVNMAMAVSWGAILKVEEGLEDVQQAVRILEARMPELLSALEDRARELQQVGRPSKAELIRQVRRRLSRPWKVAEVDLAVLASALEEVALALGEAT